MNTASLFRHLLTYLAGLGGLLLSWNLIAPDQLETVNKAAADLVSPAAIILGAIAAGVARMLLAWVQKLFGIGTGEDVAKDEGRNGSTWGVLFWIGMTAGFLCSLPSCSASDREAIKAVPVRACYIDQHGYKVCYDTQTGVEVEVDRRSGK